MAQPLQELPIEPEGLQGQPDEIVEIDGAPGGEGPLVVSVDRQPHLYQGQRLSVLLQQETQLRRGAPQVLGLLDKIARQTTDQIGPLLAAEPLPLTLVEIGVEIIVESVRVLAQPALGRLLENLGGGPLVHDLEVVGETGEGRTLPDDVVTEAMEGAHPVAQPGDEPLLADEAPHPPGEVLDGRVDQRDDEDLLVVTEETLGDDAGRQLREGPRLAAAGHRRDTHPPAQVGQHALLSRTRGKDHRFHALLPNFAAVLQVINVTFTLSWYIYFRRQRFFFLRNRGPGSAPDFSFSQSRIHPILRAIEERLQTLIEMPHVYPVHQRVVPLHGERHLQPLSFRGVLPP